MQRTQTHEQPDGRVIGWRIYAMSLAGSRPVPSSGADRGAGWEEACSHASRLGFDTLSVPLERLGDADALRECLAAARAAGLRLMVDCPAQHQQPHDALDAVLEALGAEASNAAVLLRGLGQLDAPECRERLDGLRRRGDGLAVTVWAPGMTPAQLSTLEDGAVDGVFSSLPWWDFRAAWLVEEYERLRAVAPVIAPLADPRWPDSPDSAMTGDARRLATAFLAGEAVLVPAGQALQLEQVLAACRKSSAEPAPAGGGLSRLTGPLAPVTALFRHAVDGSLLLLNPSLRETRSIQRSLVERRLPSGFTLEPDAADAAVFEIEGGGWRVVPAVFADWIAARGSPPRRQRDSLAGAMRSARIAVESVQPAVDGGAFAVKRSLGEAVKVGANIFMDGHETLAAEVLWRPVDEPEWRRSAMTALGNDAWEASITPRKLGRHVYRIRAWLDRWRSFCEQLEKKSVAGVDVSLELEEARQALQAYLERARNADHGAAARIDAALQVTGLPAGDGAALESRLAGGGPADARQVAALLDPELAAAIERVDEHAFETETAMQYPLSIERREAGFASWYELFPRSQSPEPGRHGTLRDVIARLPQISRMGFDVLYFPPIHPIGRRNRKGRNNSLKAEPGDPGSPYAIGSEAGGHDAVHPELGSLDDFRDLVAAARQHGLEIALDFAIQCSPDHPWLRENPDWFKWRADGTLKYAENPPKRYEDIVNPDFYSPLAGAPRQAALWRALRDVVLFWVSQGVRIFRVDNPHTKPLPFWEWMLREVRDRHPDVIFLSEAFTRPAMMYRLAKLGFSQSYTYFTWRNTRQELTEYLAELNRAPVRDFFRPNFFVNTPDINPWFLQDSGRGGFLIRAVLASTLSGSWGVYNGFELCVGDAVPGKEEYLDSEKYQLRHWDMRAPGNIVAEITRLNQLRRSHPALQSHLGVRFHPSDNDQVLFYSRHSAEGDSIVLVAVSLDPHGRQSATLQAPWQEWGAPAGGFPPLHDLFEDRRFELHGHAPRIELTPERPFVLWALVASHGETA